MRGPGRPLGGRGGSKGECKGEWGKVDMSLVQEARNEMGRELPKVPPLT